MSKREKRDLTWGRDRTSSNYLQISILIYRYESIYYKRKKNRQKLHNPKLDIDNLVEASLLKHVDNLNINIASQLQQRTVIFTIFERVKKRLVWHQCQSQECRYASCIGGISLPPFPLTWDGSPWLHTPVMFPWQFDGTQLYSQAERVIVRVKTRLRTQHISTQDISAQNSVRDTTFERTRSSIIHGLCIEV